MSASDQELAGELPILFTGSNVRAILEDRKTQTRRVPTRGNTFRDGIRASSERWNELDWQSPEIFVDDGPSPAGNPGPYLHVPDKDGDCSHRIYPQWRRGDRLWVRENVWLPPAVSTTDLREGADTWPKCIYSADTDAVEIEWMHEQRWKQRPSIHMPRWASRILLEITDVRVQRVQDISEEDAAAEGVEFGNVTDPVTGEIDRDACEAFAELWDSINEPRGFGWDANPWVWALTFKRMTEAAE